MSSETQSSALSGFPEALRAIAERASELERLCREAASLAERLAPAGATPTGGKPPDPPCTAGPHVEDRLSAPGASSPAGDLQPRQAALLVGVTLRGGTLDDEAFSGLAAKLDLDGPARERLFAGTQPHLVRRGGAAGITERGIESAAAWRRTLAPDLLRIATDL